MPKHTVKSTTPGEFLAVVPKLLGYHAIESLVIVGLNGRRTTAAYRVNINVLGRIDDAELLSHLMKLSECDGAVFVLYADAELTEGEPLPYTDEIISLATVAIEQGFNLKPAMIVGSNAFAIYGDDEHLPAFHPLSDIVLSPSDEEEVSDIKVRESQTSGTELPEVTDHQLAERVHAMTHTSVADAMLAGEEDSNTVIILHGMISSRPTSSTERQGTALALIAAMIDIEEFRDAAMLTWGWGLSVGLNAMTDGRNVTMDNAEELDSFKILRGQWPVRPNSSNLEAGIELCKEIAAHLPIEHRAPALTMAGWMSWALGRTSLADEFLKAALACDDDFATATAMRENIAYGGLPEWAYNKEGK